MTDATDTFYFPLKGPQDGEGAPAMLLNGEEGPVPPMIWRLGFLHTRDNA